MADREPSASGDDLEVGRAVRRVHVRGRPRLYAVAFLLLVAAGAVLVAVEIPPSLPLIWASIAGSLLAMFAAGLAVFTGRR